jgi:[acyl-carrier-protein] S-malonyltransferase
MGRVLADNFSIARDVFAKADHALGFSLSKLCFEGPAEELQLTVNTQPSILAVSVAAAEVLRERGVRPDFVAGHSLGEYSALVVAGAVSFSDAIRIVRKRGQYMQEAVPAGQGAMAAILGMPATAVEEVCRETAQDGVVSAANLNSPGQVVIAGHASAVTRAVELAKQRGARRTVMLNVSAPFHCALMGPAADRLTKDLATLDIADPGIPLVNNADGQLATTAAEVRDGLKRQVTAAVRWEESMRAMLNQGVDLFVEVGPGKVLSGLMRQIDRQAECLHAEDISSVQEVALRIGV